MTPNSNKPTAIPGWYERVHGAANTAPRWTWTDIKALLLKELW